MAKKLLFTFFLLFSIAGFSQKTIVKLSAAPNPFRSATNIKFESKKKQPVFLTIKNVLGKTVFKKVYQTQPGKNRIRFNRNNLKAGMYIYCIQSNKETVSKRFVIR